MHIGDGSSKIYQRRCVWLSKFFQADDRYQLAGKLFHELSRPQFSYSHIHPDPPIQFLRILHLFPVFLSSFLKCYIRNDNLLIVSLASYFHQKVHYILLHFAHLVRTSGLISLCI